MSDSVAHITKMIERAAQAEDSGDAMRLAQAAANAVSAVCGLASIGIHPTRT